MITLSSGEYMGPFTFADWFGVGHVHGELQPRASPQPSARDETWRHCQNFARGSQLAAPPVRTQKLGKLSPTVNRSPVCPRPVLKIRVKGGL